MNKFSVLIFFSLLTMSSGCGMDEATKDRVLITDYKIKLFIINQDTIELQAHTLSIAGNKDRFRIYAPFELQRDDLAPLYDSLMIYNKWTAYSKYNFEIQAHEYCTFDLPYYRREKTTFDVKFDRQTLID